MCMHQMPACKRVDLKRLDCFCTYVHTVEQVHRAPFHAGRHVMMHCVPKQSANCIMGHNSSVC
jgi:hypothetical protein